MTLDANDARRLVIDARERNAKALADIKARSDHDIESALAQARWEGEQHHKGVLKDLLWRIEHAARRGDIQVELKIKHVRRTTGDAYLAALSTPIVQKLTADGFDVAAEIQCVDGTVSVKGKPISNEYVAHCLRIVVGWVGEPKKDDGDHICDGNRGHNAQDCSAISTSAATERSET